MRINDAEREDGAGATPQMPVPALRLLGAQGCATLGAALARLATALPKESV
jgi:hypothetical protein